MERIIIHVDMDAFFAAVEIRDDPSLRGKPLIIGSLPGERGVVATASYEARKYGVRSAMNIKEAYRRCPRGVYMHPNIDKYRAVSRQLRAIWGSYADALETVAFDEAYLDVTRTAGDFDSAARMGREIKRRIREELRLSCSVGVAYSKSAAKTASEEKKPDGYFEIRTPEDFAVLIEDRDVRVLSSVGEMTAEKLHSRGIRTVRDVRTRSDEVIRLLGKQGEWITGLARGVDEREVTPYRPEDAQSIGREVTFQEDVNDFSLLRDILVVLSICVAARAKRVGLHGGGVTLKLTYADMRAVSRSRQVRSADHPAEIFAHASDMLSLVERRPVRLIGAGIYDLSPELALQLSFDDVFSDAPPPDEQLGSLLDELGERYGLDFRGNVDKLAQTGVLHRTVEYMRKRAAAAKE
ncbi:MAG: DNA polymerase IV [Firmicutes bacterium]|nr:DNA polymerase IV [Bacillota bacterium]